MPQPIETVLAKLDWMRAERIWPNGLRYLWTDAFGMVLLVSLYHQLKEDRWLDEAQQVVSEVERVLGRERGMRIGEQPERDGQYFHYLGMWLFALARLGDIDERYRQRGVELVRQIHPRFVIPGTGVVWKMEEDLSRPYPGYGLGALDAFGGYVSYRLLNATELAPEIAEMKQLVEASYPHLTITQDLGIGMMLWFSHFWPEERWAQVQRSRSLQVLEGMWQKEGYFCRQPELPEVKFAFTNYGVGIGLQAVEAMPDRVGKIHQFFGNYRSGDEYDRNAITHVMECSSRFPGVLLKNR